MLVICFGAGHLFLRSSDLLLFLRLAIRLDSRCQISDQIMDLSVKGEMSDLAMDVGIEVRCSS